MNFGIKDIFEDSICGIPNDVMDLVIDEYLKNDELIKCPKCKGEPEVIGHYIKGVANRYHYFVRCKQCKYRKHNEFKKKEKAIKNWNIQ